MRPCKNRVALHIGLRTGLAPGQMGGHIPRDESVSLGAEPGALPRRAGRAPLWPAGAGGKRSRGLRIVVGITGASGTLYAQRLLDLLNGEEHEVHLILSQYARAVIGEELPGGLRLSEKV